MAALLAMVAKVRRTPLHRLPPAEARRQYESAAEVLDLPRQPLPRTETWTIPTGPGVSCPVRLYDPVGDGVPLPVLLFFHGGGFTIGSLETHDSLCRQIAWRSGAAVLALDYRLAPEHPFPAAVDDAWGALQWLHAQGGRVGLDTGRLAVGGDSAGGTLAAVVALMARDAGLPLRLQALITPGTSPDMSHPSHHRYASGHLLEREAIAWFFDHYLPGEARFDWRFAPLLADVDGVAPAWIGLAECDPLVDEGIAYGDHLRLAGVSVDLEVWRGVTHDFIKLGRALPEALEAQAHLARALRAALDLHAPPPAALEPA
jgi:acetyl esterase